MAGAQPRPLAGRSEGLEVGRVTWSEAVTARLLPLPDDPRFQRLIDEWPRLEAMGLAHPRSFWLRNFEDALLPFYPVSTSRDRSLTARHYAPFPLRDGPNVP